MVARYPLVMVSAENRYLIQKVVEFNEKIIVSREGLKNSTELVMYPETNNSRKLFPVKKDGVGERAVFLELERPLTVGKVPPTGVVARGRET